MDKYYYIAYANVLVFLVLGLLLSAVLLVTAFFLSSRIRGDFERLSAYECGFDPFGDTRIESDIHFYVVGLLFIVFDLEIIFLYP
jgi:NADH-quinone oxidoreductase subunit A